MTPARLLLTTLLLAISIPGFAGDTPDPRLAALNQRLAVGPWEKVWQGNADGPAATFALDATVFHSAPDCWRLEVPAGAGPANSRIALLQIGAGLSAGTLAVTGAVRVDSDAGLIALIRVYGFDAGWQRSFEKNLAVLGADVPRGQWRDLTGTVEVPAGLNSVGLQVAVVQGSGTIRLDDLAVTQAPLAKQAVVERDAAGQRIVLRPDFADPASVKGFANGAWKHPQAIRADRVDGVPVLAIDVQGASFAESTPGFAVAKNKVYRIAFTGRGVGQIEKLSMCFRRATPPSWTIHGEDSWRPQRAWTRYQTQVRVQYADDQTRLQLWCDGSGTFQIRDLEIIETDAYDVPAATTAERGELLAEPGFALGGLGWFSSTSWWGDFARRHIAAGSPSWFSPGVEGTGVWRNPAGMFAFSTAIGLVRLEYGRSYTWRVTGAAKEGDVHLWLARPSGESISAKSFMLNQPLAFHDGVAEGTYVHTLPSYGTLSAGPQLCYVRLEHYGKAGPAEITGVSLREGVAGAARSAVAVALAGTPGISQVATAREPVTVQVRSLGLAEGASVRLVATDARGVPAGEVAVTLIRLPGGGLGAEAQLPALPIGWYQVAAAMADAKLVSLQLAVLPPPRVAKPNDPRFLGSHTLGTHDMGDGDPRPLQHAALLGLRMNRCFEFSWPRLEPEKGTYVFPVEELDLYLNAGIDPMIVLTGTARWASSAPPKVLADITSWNKPWSWYPAKDLADWRAYVSKTVAACAGKARTYEIWNEPDLGTLQPDPAGKLSVAQTYVALVTAAYEEIKRADPQAVVVAGVTAGTPEPFLSACIAAGMLEHCDVVSCHDYSHCEQGALGAGAFASTLATLHRLMDAHGLRRPVWDSESGVSIPDGSDGLSSALRLIQGVIGRQVAGFARYYLYNGTPRQYPGHDNFQMINGFAGQPLVSQPLLAVWDRLLGDAVFVADRGDAKTGALLYEFRGPSGSVLVGWCSTPGGTATVPVALPGAVVLDAFGRHLGSAGATLELGAEPRYLVPAALLPRLGKQP